ncbi:transposase [Actinomadura sp. 3N407]|uniref:transposase n=1 Tax=Actinomadura sp. 3N407 TaxID=3457423 RepID=UPI003FCE5A33
MERRGSCRLRCRGPRIGGTSPSPSRSTANVPARHARPGSAVGVDLDVKTLLTAVDDHGTVIEIPGLRALKARLRKLRRLGKADARRQRGSGNRAKADAKLARHHARVANSATMRSTRPRRRSGQ